MGIEHPASCRSRGPGWAQGQSGPEALVFVLSPSLPPEYKTCLPLSATTPSYQGNLRPSLWYLDPGGRVILREKKSTGMLHNAGHSHFRGCMFLQVLKLRECTSGDWSLCQPEAQLAHLSHACRGPRRNVKGASIYVGGQGAEEEPRHRLQRWQLLHVIVTHPTQRLY